MILKNFKLISNLKFQISNLLVFLVAFACFLSFGAIRTRAATVTSYATGSWSAVNTWKYPVTGSTLTCKTNTTAVTGISTTFTTQVAVGQFIYDQNNAYIGTIASITNDTALVLNANAATTQTGKAWSQAKVPLSTDAVVIATGTTVTVDSTYTAATLDINAAATANGISIASPNSLTVSGAITMNAPSAAVNSTIAVSNGTLSAASIAIPGSGTASRNCIVSLSSGTITVSGSIAFSGTAAQAQLTFTGSGTLNVGGDLGSGGTFTKSTGKVVFNGTGAQTANGYNFNDVTISNSATAGTKVTAAGTFAVGGALLITDGQLDTSTSTFSVTGTTTMNNGGEIHVTSTTGSKDFTGTMTIDSGGKLYINAAETIGFTNDLSNSGTVEFDAAGIINLAGSLTNAGTWDIITSVTGAISMTGASKTISGAGAIVMASLAATSVTNSGTLTVTGVLSGTLFTNGNGSNGSLTVGATPTVATLTANATANTVTYTGGTMKATSAGYYDLTIAGTVIGIGDTVNHNLVVSSGTLTLSNATAFTVTGTTNLTGALALPVAANNKTFTGVITVNGAGNLSGASTTVVINGGIANANTVSLTGTVTTNVAGAAFSGANNIAIATYTVTSPGTASNTGTVTISGVLGGNGSFTNSTSANLSLGATPTITTLTADASGNTVTYTGGTMKATSAHYYNLTIAGTVVGIGDTVDNNLVVTSGTLTLSNATAFTVTGTTNLTGALALPVAANNKTFTGVITVNGAGNLSGASTTVVINGGIANANTVSLTGTVTTNVAGAAFSGANNIAIATYTVTSPGTASNTGTVTISTDLGGNGSFTNANGGTLNLSGTATITNLAASANTNTVNYNGAAAQTVKSGTYYILKINNAHASGASLGAASATTDLTIGDVTAASLFYDAGYALTASGILHLHQGTFKLGNSAATTWPGFGTNTIDAGTTVEYASTAPQTVSGVPAYKNLTISGASTKTLGAATGVATAFTLATGATIDPGSYLLSGAGTFNITGTVIVPGALFSTNYTIAGAKTISAGSTFNYTNATTPTIDASFTYQNLQYSGSGTAGASADLTIQGTLSNTGGGVLAFGSNNIILSGTVSTNNIAGFTTTGTVSLTKTAGTATFTGTVNGGGLTINSVGGAGTLNLGSGLTHTFTGTWTRTAGILNGGSSILNLAGTVSGTGGTFTCGTGTVNYNGAAAQTVAGVVYNILKINNAHASGASLSAAATVAGLTIGDDTSSLFYDGGYAITASGTIHLHQGTFKLGNSTPTTWPAFGVNTIDAGTTVEYASSVAQTVSTAPGYSHLTFSGAGTKTTGSSTLSIGGNWAVGSTTALNTSNTVVSLTGNLSGSGSITQGTGLITVGGDWTNTGTFTATSAGVTMSGTGKQITGSGGITFTTLTIDVSVTNNNTGTILVSTALSGNGTLTQGTSSILSLGGTSGITGLDASTYVNTVNYSGAGQTVRSINYSTLTLSNSGTKTLQTGTTAITGDLNLSGTAAATTVIGLAITGNISVGAGTSLTVNHDIAVAGNFSTTTSGIITTSAGTPTVTMSGTSKNLGTGSGAITLHHLIVSGSVSFSGSGTNIFNGDVTVNAAKTINLNSNVEIKGNLTNTTDGVIGNSAGSPVITMSGSSKTIGGGTTGAVTIYALTVSGSVTWTNGGTNTVTGDINVNAGATLNLNSAIGVGGSILTTTTGSVNTTSGSPEVTLTGSGKSIGGGSGTIAFYKLTLSNNGTTTINSDISVSNTLNVTTTDTLSIAVSKSVTAVATLTFPNTAVISGAGTLIYQGSATFPATGTLSSILRFDATNNIHTVPVRTYSGAVQFYNGSNTDPRTITLGADATALTFGSDVTLNSAGSQALTVNTHASGPAVNIAGALAGTAAGTAELLTTGAGIWTVTGAVNLTGITLTATGGTFRMNGTVNLTSSGNTFNNFSVTANTVSAQDATDIDGDFAVTSGGFAMAGGAVNMTVAGDFTLSAATTFTGNTGGGKLIFNGASTLFTDSTAGQDLGDVQIGNSPGTTNLATNFKANSLTVVAGDYFNTCQWDLDIGNGGISFSGIIDTSDVGHDVACAGPAGNETLMYTANNFALNSGATFYQDQSTLYFDDTAGTDTLITDGSFSLYNLVIQPTAGVIIQVQDPLTVQNSLTITSGTLDTVSGESNQINVGYDWTNDSVFEANSGKVVLDGSASMNLDTNCTTPASCTDGDFYDLEINKTSGTDANDNVTLSNFGIRTTHSLVITDGELIQTTYTVVAEGTSAVSVAALGKWTNTSTGDLTLGGTFDNLGTVTFQGTTSACGETDAIAITSTTTDVRAWTGNTGTFNINDVTCAYQSSTPNIYAYSSVNSGTCTVNWSFPGCPQAVSGNIYDFGTVNTAYSGCDADTGTYELRLRSSAITYSASCSNATGAYSFADVTVPAAGEAMVAWIEAKSTDGALVIRYDGSGDSTANTFYDQAVTVTSDDTSGVTIDNMNTYDYADDDGNEVPYTATNASPDTLVVNSGYELIVKINSGVAADSTVFDPGGTVTTNATGGDLHVMTDSTAYLDTGTSAIGRDIEVDSSATLYIDGTYSYTVGGGDITTGNSAVVSTSTGSPTVTISTSGNIGGGTSPTLTFHNLSTSGSGTISIANTATINNDLTVGSGTTLNVNASIGVAGNFNNTTSGIINTTSGSPTVTMSGASKTLGTGTGAITINALTVSAGSTTFSGSGTNIFNSDVAVSAGATLNINSSAEFKGSLTNATSGVINTTSGSPILTFSGSGKSIGGGTTGAITIHALTVTGSATLTNGGTNTFNSDVNVNAGATFNINSSVGLAGSLITASTGIIGTTAGTPTVSFTGTTPALGGGSGTITLYSLSIGGSTTLTANTSFSLKGNYANSGIFTANSKTVTMSATDAGHTLTGTMTGTSSFYDLVFDDGGTSGAWTFAANPATITRDFTITGGAVTAPSGNLTIARNFTNNDSFDANGGTIIFDTTTASTLLYSVTTTFNNFKIETATKQMYFEDTDAVVTDINGLFTITGTDCSGNRVFLDGYNGLGWEINASDGSTAITYADVEDSTANGTEITASNSTADNDSNVNWSISGGSCGVIPSLVTVKGITTIKGGVTIK